MKRLLAIFLSAAFFIVFAVQRSAAINVGTSVTATAATVTLTQSTFRWYENIDTLTPTTALAVENTEMTTPSTGTAVRLRINLLDTGVALGTGATFTLQYSNSTSSGWSDVGSSTSWIFNNNSGVADGQVIVSPVLSNSDVGETYNESNPTTGTPTAINPTQRGEWDWSLTNNSAAVTSAWYFRMIYASSTVLDAYSVYPSFSAATTPAPSPPASPGGSFGVPAGPGGLFASGTPPLRPPFPPPDINTAPIPSVILDTIDLNGDRKIDMEDFSILLYHWNEQGPVSNPYDLNDDGRIDMADVSILLFYWTG